jgi:CIC family chloride channel protein
MIDQLKDYLFDRTKYDIPVKQLVQKTETLIYPYHTLDYVSKQFQATKQWNLPVVSKNGKYLGFVSRFKVMEKIKETLLRENGF